MAVRPFLDKSGNPVPRRWIIEWYPAGRKGPQKRKVYDDLSEADAQQIYLQLRRKSGTPMGFDPTIKDVSIDWLRQYSIDIAASSVTDIEWALVSLLKYFGSYRLSDLTLPLFEQYMKNRRATLWRPPIIGKKNPDKVYKPGKPISKSRINTELKYMSMMLSWAADRKYMLPLPFTIPKFKRLPKKVVVTPEPANVDKLLARCDVKTALVVMLYHDAGLRRTEGLQLRGENVFLDAEYFGKLASWKETQKEEETAPPTDGSYLVIKGKGDKERVVIIASERLHIALEKRIDMQRLPHYLADRQVQTQSQIGQPLPLIGADPHRHHVVARVFVGARH